MCGEAPRHYRPNSPTRQGEKPGGAGCHELRTFPRARGPSGARAAPFTEIFYDSKNISWFDSARLALVRLWGFRFTVAAVSLDSDAAPASRQGSVGPSP